MKSIAQFTTIRLSLATQSPCPPSIPIIAISNISIDIYSNKINQRLYGIYILFRGRVRSTVNTWTFASIFLKFQYYSNVIQTRKWLDIFISFSTKVIATTESLSSTTLNTDKDIQHTVFLNQKMIRAYIQGCKIKIIYLINIKNK